MNLPGIFYFIILLSLAGCISKKEAVNNNALPLVIDRKDVMLLSNGELPSKGLIDIKSGRDYKVLASEKTAATTISSSTAASSPRPAQAPLPGERDPMTRRLVNQKLPQTRHEKMMEGTSSVFTPPASAAKMNFSNPKNFKK